METAYDLQKPTIPGLSLLFPLVLEHTRSSRL